MIFTRIGDWGIEIEVLVILGYLTHASLSGCEMSDTANSCTSITQLDPLRLVLKLYARVDVRKDVIMRGYLRSEFDLGGEKIRISIS